MPERTRRCPARSRREPSTSLSASCPAYPGGSGGDGFSLDEVLATYEQKMLYQALEHSRWVKTRAAELLKIKRTTLIEKMKRLGIPLKGTSERAAGAASSAEAEGSERVTDPGANN